MTVGELKELLAWQDDRALVKIEIPLSKLPTDDQHEEIEDDVGRPVWPLDVVDGKRVTPRMGESGKTAFVLQVAEEE